MRSKIGYGVLGVTVAFLLATNPVVVNAAGFIGSAEIKNNSIKSKDIKNNQIQGVDVKDGKLTGADVADGGLTSADLAAGTIPASEIKSIQRFNGTPGGGITAAQGIAFVSNTVTVTVEATDIIVVAGSQSVFGHATGDDADAGACYRTAGAVTAPLPLGGTSTQMSDLDLLATDATLPANGIGSLPAGSYEIGACANPSVDVTRWDANGWVQVLRSSAALANAARPGPQAAAHE